MSNANRVRAALKKIPLFDDRPLVTVVELAGAIGDAGLGGRGLSLKRLAPAIEAAFKPKKLAAVALAINSPGGSPVQSAMILSAIRRAAAKKGTKVISFIEDVGASGGYLMAIAGDEIYADRSSIVGSIGVISAGFGFHAAIDRLGVERRVRTAGENKGQLDPFRPQNPEDVERLDAILADMHAHFIDQVRERRGDSLRDDHKDLFSGAFWTAPRAVERGLIDGIAHLGDFIRAEFGEDVIIKRIKPRRGGLRQLLGAEDAATARRRSETALFSAPDVAGTAREWALWSRYGV